MNHDLDGAWTPELSRTATPQLCRNVLVGQSLKREAPLRATLALAR